MTVLGTNLPEDADLATCIDSAVAQLCDVVAQRHDLSHDIRTVLCNAAATLAVALAFLHKDQRRTPRIKKYRARCRKVM
jgi:hypothetical protein